MATGDFPNWTIALLSGVLSLGGAWVGSSIAARSQVRIAREARDAERVAIAHAIAGEISAYLEMVQFRGFIARTEAFIRICEAGHAVRPRGFAVKRDQSLAETAPAFHASLAKLGVLGPLAGDVASFYAIISSIQATGGAADRGEFDTMPPVEMAVFLREELDALQEQLVRGRRIVTELRKFE